MDPLFDELLQRVQALEQDSLIASVKCEEKKHCVVPIVDERNGEPQLFLACVRCDSLWAVMQKDPYMLELMVRPVLVDPEALALARSDVEGSA